MSTFYDTVVHAFVILGIVCAGVQLYIRRISPGEGAARLQTSPAFQRFQRGFLVIYLLAMLSDWLQGSFVYALYSYYGFSKEEIAHLFIAGFASSMLFGTFVGALADKYGRRRMSIAYGVIYGLACLTKLSSSFSWLMFGRILSGVATSLLFSSFESWMVSQHNALGFDEKWLSQTFSYAVFGNGIIAILAGLLASAAADMYGYIAPFMLALFFLIMCSLMVASLWEENYGDAKIDISEGWNNAWTALRSDARIPLLGLVQSLFEAGMYSFVFMWTPGLETAVGSGEALPFGVIFSCFMISIMVGSGLFSYLVRHYSVERIAQMNLFVAAAFLSIPYFSGDANTIFASFLGFEVCCGIYFPSQGTLRGKYIPEHCRSALMNVFRVPLNFLVVVVLVKVGSFENSTVFAIISVWLLTAGVLQTTIVQKAEAAGGTVKGADGREV